MRKNGDYSCEGSDLQFASMSWVNGERLPCVSRYSNDGETPRWESVPITAAVQAELKARGLRLVSYEKETAEALGIPRARYVDGKMTLPESARAVAPSATATPASVQAASAVPAMRTIAEVERDSAQMAADAARKQAEQAEAVNICRAAKAQQNWGRTVAKYGGKLTAEPADDSWASIVKKHSPRA